MRQAQAQALVAAAVAHAEAEQLQLSVAVVDARGHEVATLRMDGATWFTPGIARSKARTAAAFRRPSADLAELRTSYPEVLRLATQQLPEPPTDLPGGIPIYRARREGELLGAIGVSGGTPDQDVATGLTALANSGLVEPVPALGTAL